MGEYRDLSTDCSIRSNLIKIPVEGVVEMKVAKKDRTGRIENVSILRDDLLLVENVRYPQEVKEWQDIWISGTIVSLSPSNLQ